MHFSWIVEFPMFAYDEKRNAGSAMHHPFTAPRPQDFATAGDRSGQVPRAGLRPGDQRQRSRRRHDPNSRSGSCSSKVFALLGIDAETAEERFGFLLDALQFGAPPHGGIALGIDRLVMLFGGLDNIRDCIAFPKTQKATDLMTDAPNVVDAKQLKELGIKIVELTAAAHACPSFCTKPYSRGVRIAGDRRHRSANRHWGPSGSANRRITKRVPQST